MKPSSMDFPVRMADVAHALGVHQTTVSLALREHPSIPRETREKVREMAEKMGYRRNPLVSALISERKKRKRAHGTKLALLSAGVRADSWRWHSPTYERLREHLIGHAEALGYGIEEFPLYSPTLSAAQLRRILLHRGIRGLLVAPLPTDCHEIDFDFSDFAAVALRYTLKTPEVDHVSIDYCATMETALNHLEESGHRRIAFLTKTLIDERVNHLSLGVYLARRHLRQRALLPPLLLPLWEEGPVMKWIGQHKPDAIITQITTGYETLKSYLKNAGWDVPERLSLVNLDCYANSPETGVMQNLAGEARAAIGLLTSRVERAQFGLPEQPQATLVKGTWRDGTTFQERPSRR